MMSDNMNFKNNLQFDYSEIEEITYEDKGFFETAQGARHEALPEFLRVRVCSRPGKNSLVFSEVWLPMKWNGIFVGTGNGGLAGNIDYGSLSDYIRSGCAVANTDMGTSGGRERAISNEDVIIDFGGRATKAMGDAAKKIIEAFYGKRHKYSYFIGNSTGGQQACAMAQRYPCDYDGIIAGVPANNRTMLHTYFLWNYVHLKPKGEEGLFSREEIHAVTGRAGEFFQLRGDGEKGDNFVSFPAADEDTIEAFIKYLSEKEKLSKKQLDALRCVYEGPVNKRTGVRIYNGMPIGSEKYGCGIFDHQGEEPPHFYPFIWTFGADYDAYSFDFDYDMEKVNEKLSGHLNANCTDLDEFFARGGKMIMYSGSCDPCVPFPDAMNYYIRLEERYGKAAKDSFKFFLMPGKDHGNGGDGTRDIWQNEKGGSVFDALRDWREKGEEPQFLAAAGYDEDGKIRFVRKIYPYKKEDGVCPPSCSDYYLNR